MTSRVHVAVVEARVRELEAQVANMQEIALMFCQIAYGDGFRDGVLFVPSALSVEAYEASGKWIADRREAIATALNDAATSPTEN